MLLCVMLLKGLSETIPAHGSKIVDDLLLGFIGMPGECVRRVSDYSALSPCTVSQKISCWAYTSPSLPLITFLLFGLLVSVP